VPRRSSDRRRADGPHVAALVENVSLAHDNRLMKQVELLLGAGYRVSVVTREDPANAPWRDRPGMRLVEYPAPVDGASTRGHLAEYAVSLRRQLPALARLHRRDRIDLLQVCQPPDLYFPVAAVAHLLGVRVLLDQRDLMPETLEQRYETVPGAVMAVLHWLERRTQRHADAAVTVNGYLRDRLTEARGGPGVEVVANGPVLARVDEALAGLDDDLRDRLRHGAPEAICWAGKMGRQDRVDEVLRVLADLVHTRGRTGLVLLLPGDGELLDELRDLAGTLGVGDRVHFPGWLSEVELYRHLAACDLGLDTSLQPEVTPVKAMEYLAVGLPLVAFDVTETRRLATGAGVLVEPGDAAALADAVEALLDDPERRAALGSAGRARVRAELAWERQGETYLATVAALTARARRPVLRVAPAE
jgi:glycosyltransferase involved in cell wall biosynthesis